MTHILVFNSVLILACTYALWVGGAPERATALVFVGAAMASYAVPYSGFHVVEAPLFLIDLLTLLALVLIAMTANRFWPLYVAAIQLLTVAVHAVKAYQPALAFWMYGGALGKMAYPTLILLAVGAIRHRNRMARFGGDRAWSISPAKSVVAPLGGLCSGGEREEHHGRIARRPHRIG